MIHIWPEKDFRFVFEACFFFCFIRTFQIACRNILECFAVEGEVADSGFLSVRIIFGVESPQCFLAVHYWPTQTAHFVVSVERSEIVTVADTELTILFP